MAIINFYTKEDESEQYSLKVIDFDGNAAAWLIKNIAEGENFAVYEGELSKENEISRDYEKISNADEVSVFSLPGTGIEVAYFVAAVFLVVALTQTPSALTNVNRTQESPNNALSDRDNKARPNQRIVDICGQVRSIPDVLSREYSRFIDDVEQRVGYYCVARNNLLIEDIKEGDTLVKDIKGSSVGVYGAFKSPNNSVPDIQVGDPIDEDVYNVTKSPDAVGQTLRASNENTLLLDGVFSVESVGAINDVNEEIDFTESFEAGDFVDLLNIYITISDGGDDDGTYQIGADTGQVLTVEPHRMTFNIILDDSWAIIGASPVNINESDEPRIEDIIDTTIGPFKMTSFKINRLLVNVNALNGVYKENSSGKKETSVFYYVRYQKLGDDGSPIGAETTILTSMSGKDSLEKGQTTEIDLGGDTFVQ